MTEDHSALLQRLEIPPPPGWPPGLAPVWFEVEGARRPLEVNAEARLATWLVPAMGVGRDLALPEGFDQALARQLPQAIGLLAHWYPKLAAIHLRPAGGDGGDPGRSRSDGPASTPREGRGTGCFFTGGVDSFRTLQRQLDQVDTLVFVHGFDVRDDRSRLWAETRGMLHEVADELGKRLVIVKTNLRDVTDRVIEWDAAHGVALAAVARLLQDEFADMFLASSAAEHRLVPWGSHPRLDPAWSTPGQGFYHDGAGEERWQKLQHLVAWPLALKHLRVCTWNTDDSYNCGRCSKCLRTLAALELIDAQGAVATLPPRLDLERLGGLRVRSSAELPYLEEMLEEADRQGDGRQELAAVLRRLLESTDGLDSALPRHLAKVPTPALKVSLLTLEGSTGGGDGEGPGWRCRLGLSRDQWSGELLIEGSGEGPAPGVGEIADAAFCWLVPAAMHLGVALEFGDGLEVDAGLVGRVEYFMPALVHLLPFRGMRPAPLRVGRRVAAEQGAAGSHGRRVGADHEIVLGAAFSGGVDACAMAATIEPRPELLIHLHGIDSERQDADRLVKVQRRARQAAAAIGRPLAMVNTNLRQLLTGGLGVPWKPVFRVGVMGLGHLFAHRVNSFAIASDQSFDTLIRYKTIETGHHPVLMEAFSGSRLRLEYWDDGHDRAGRIRQLAAHCEEALKWLVVCAEEAQGLLDDMDINCGRCEKCLRTMGAIRLADRQPDPRAFPGGDFASKLAAIPRLHHLWLDYWQGTEAEFLAKPGMADEAAAVTALLQRSIEPHRRSGEMIDWLKRDGNLAALRRHPGYGAWLRESGRPMAGAVLGDKPARRVLQWLDHPRGWKRFRQVALDRLLASDPATVRRWVRRAMWRRRLRLRPKS